MVTAKDGRVEPFFGSDRFHYMVRSGLLLSQTCANSRQLDYLQVPYQDIEILPKDKSKL